MFEISHRLRVFIALHFPAKTSGEGRKIGQGKIYMGFFYSGMLRSWTFIPDSDGPENSILNTVYNTLFLLCIYIIADYAKACTGEEIKVLFLLFFSLYCPHGNNIDEFNLIITIL